MSSSTIRRLKKELVNFRNSPVDGCLIEANNEDLFNWQATIRGLEGTPYEGGNFLVNIHHPQDYPLHPPVYNFATKIYHPNVDSDIVESDRGYWRARLGVRCRAGDCSGV